MECEEEEKKKEKKKRKVEECSEERELDAIANMEEYDDLCNYKPTSIHPNKSTSKQ
jgi:hypothetical protein